MKKSVLLLPALLFILASCMKGSSYQATYVLEDTGDYSNASELFPDENTTVYLFPTVESLGAEGVLGVGGTIAYFSSKATSDYSGGFALSRQEWAIPDPDDGEEDTETEIPAVPGEYCVYGDSGSETNTFFYFRQTSTMPEHDIAFLSYTVGTCAPIRAFICNSAATVRAIKGENVEDGVFNLKGDITLTATGYLGGNQTGTASFLLAGKGKSKLPATETNPQRDSLVTSWSAFDLSDLGSIQYIDFEVTFSDPSDRELLPYTDFCMDNFASQINISMQSE